MTLELLEVLSLATEVMTKPENTCSGKIDLRVHLTSSFSARN